MTRGSKSILFRPFAFVSLFTPRPSPHAIAEIFLLPVAAVGFASQFLFFLWVGTMVHHPKVHALDGRLAPRSPLLP
jgi:hypothetical protein